MLQSDEDGRTSIQYNAEPRSAEILLKTIVSINQLSVYCSPDLRREGDNVAPNDNLNIAQDFVTNLTRPQTPDLFDRASRNRSRSVHDKNSQVVEFTSWGQVSLVAGFSKTVEVGEYFVTRSVILLTELRITTTCRERSAMRVVTLQPR